MNKPVKDIDAYISNQEEKVRATLSKIRQTIKMSAPDAVEVISYSMPAFKYHGILAYFAVFTNHYSLFVNQKVIEAYKEELNEYETSKGTIRIPKGKPVPVRLVSRIIKSVVKINLEKAKAKRKLKSKQKSYQ
jgi:uncharacterized protein YdhG (YjbR/CyaY superfamily)